MKFLKKFKTDLCVLLGYITLTLILTYPLILKFRTHLPGQGDSQQTYWLFWWVKYALLELHTTPFFTNYLFYPVGSTLGALDVMPYNSFLAVPLQILFGGTVSYNLLFLSGFFISAFGVYLLSFHLTKNRTASFIAGFAFAFSAQRMGYALGFMNLLTVQWLPFYILFFIKLIKEKTLKNAVFAALFLSLTSLSSGYFMVLAVIFSLLFLLYRLIFNRKTILNREFLKLFVIFSFLSLLILIPFKYPMMRAYSKGLLEVPWFGRADLAAFFIPSELHPILGKYVVNLTEKIEGSAADSTMFIGYTLLFLVLYAIFKCRKNEIRFWKLSAIFFIFLSLGPFLKFLGHSDFFGFRLYLPFLFLKDLPIFNAIVRLTTCGVMISLSFVILAAYALTNIFSKIKNHNIIAFTIGGLIIFESLAIPIQIRYIPIPEFYQNLPPGDYALLELPVGEYPIGWDFINNKYPGKYPDKLHHENLQYYCFNQYYQTVHEKPILGGYLARNIPKEAIDFTDNTPVINNLKYPDLALQENIKRNPEKALSILKNYNIRYVILHRYYYYKNSESDVEEIYIRKEYFTKAKELLDDIFGRYFYKNDSMIVYEVN